MTIIIRISYRYSNYIYLYKQVKPARYACTGFTNKLYYMFATRFATSLPDWTQPNV